MRVVTQGRCSERERVRERRRGGRREGTDKYTRVRDGETESTSGSVFVYLGTAIDKTREMLKQKPLYSSDCTWRINCKIMFGREEENCKIVFGREGEAESVGPRARNEDGQIYSDG